MRMEAAKFNIYGIKKPMGVGQKVITLEQNITIHK